MCALSAFWSTEMHGYIDSNNTNTVIREWLSFYFRCKKEIHCPSYELQSDAKRRES